ncbi:MAG: thioredoxin family protein [Acholeplasmataceae bacterium]|jgi:glutaredoxin-like protein|nr:thioredoxin family protein [Acholeplasmataceae bacterium]
MQLLNKELQDQIREYLSPMKNNVTLMLFTQESPCETCTETRQLLSEVSELNDKISFVEKDLVEDIVDVDKYGITLTPSFIILDANGNYTGVKFNGIPAGHEINSFLTAIIDMSNLEFGFDKDILDRISKINKPVNIKVFVTLSCPHCPGAVTSAHRLAMLNKNIEGEMIEAQTFAHLSEQYQVSGVPKIVINEKYELLGNQPIEAFLNELEKL